MKLDASNFLLLICVKVYAVGTYLDPLAMTMIKNQSESSIKNALLDPSYPRTIRIVMNRNLSIDKYTAAIIESLEPRMAGEDLEALEVGEIPLWSSF